MAPNLRTTLLALAEHDLAVRTRLAGDGSLFDGYHPEMRAVHEENAGTLDAILDEQGWPVPGLAGEDGAEAAWLIAQHAIGLPAFQRRCLAALQIAAAKGQVPPWQPAYLFDRIRTLEGMPQVYGTQFDWDAEGLMSPLPIEDSDAVDERRASIGLPPIAETTGQHRRNLGSEKAPADREKRAREMAAWAREAGWR